MDLPKSKNGYCPVCRRKLKSKESIERGIGPKCEHRLLHAKDGGNQQLALNMFSNTHDVRYKR